MQDKIEALIRDGKKLRADLAATNSALFALLSAMPAEVREQALRNFAATSARKQHFAEQLPIPEARMASTLLQEGEQRLYAQMLEEHRRAG